MSSQTPENQKWRSNLESSWTNKPITIGDNDMHGRWLLIRNNEYQKIIEQHFKELKEKTKMISTQNFIYYENIPQIWL